MRPVLALILSTAFALSAGGACPAVSFEPRINHAITSGSPYVGSVTDVNADGRDDITVYYNNSSGFQTFLSNPDGTVTPGTRIVTLGVSDVQVGDLDADGFADAAQGSGFEIRFYEGTGTGAYIVRQSIPLSGSPVSIEFADFNEDGAMDAVAVVNITASIVILTQTAPWTFAAGPDISTGAAVIGDPSVADLDADGNLDVAVVGDNTVKILYGNGDGTFDPVQTLALPASTAGASSLTISDFNGDGRLDIGAGVISVGVAILINDGGRAFHHDRTLAPGAGARTVRAADLNADGRSDLIVSTYGGFYTLLASPATMFNAPVFWQIPEQSDSAPQDWSDTFVFEVGDTRGDGRTDIVGRIGRFIGPHRIVTYPNACVPPPTLTSLTPGFGPAEGGTEVTITGESLLTTTQVLFGSTPATILGKSATAVTVRTPAATPSIVDVMVTTGGGSATLPGAFRFMGATTTTVTPDRSVAVVGEQFQLVATVAPTLTGGTVTFMEGGTVHGTAPVVNGRASITIISGIIAPRTITANFSGTPIYFPSSGTTTFRAFFPSTLTLQTSATPELNAPYRVIATVGPPVTGGTITFTVNGTVAGTVPVTNGAAFIDLVATQPGAQQIQATFSGFGDFAPQTATIAFNVGHAIPTLSELALLALAAVIAAVAAMKLRS